MNLLILSIPPKPDFDSTVQAILGRAEYRHLRKGLLNFIEELKERLAQRLMDMLEKAGQSNAPEISDKLSTIFMIIGITVIAAVIVIIIVRLGRTMEKSTKVREILGEKIDEGTTPAVLRKKASVFQEQEDFRQAVRYDFIALLLLMHEKNLIYLDETKTNQEIYNHLSRNRFSMLQLFRYLIEGFNSSWYGHKAYQKDSYDLWTDNMSKIWNEVAGYEEKG